MSVIETSDSGSEIPPCQYAPVTHPSSYPIPLHNDPPSPHLGVPLDWPRDELYGDVLIEICLRFVYDEPPIDSHDQTYLGEFIAARDKYVPNSLQFTEEIGYHCSHLAYNILSQCPEYIAERELVARGVPLSMQFLYVVVDYYLVACATARRYWHSGCVRLPNWTANTNFHTDLVTLVNSREFSYSVREMLFDCPQDSTPGMPFNSVANDARTIADTPEMLAEFVRHVACRVLALDSFITGESEKTLPTPVELVQLGKTDPVTVFIKQEPHTTEKVAAGRNRVINRCSLVDQVVEKLLFFHLTKFEINNWSNCPSKPGVGFDDSQLLVLADAMEDVLNVSPKHEAIGLDVSGWDLSLQRVLMLVAELSIKLQINHLGEVDRYLAYCELLDARCAVACSPLIILSDGTAITQQCSPALQFPTRWGFQLEPDPAVEAEIRCAHTDKIVPFIGTMLSGRYVTSYLNSRTRVIAGAMASCYTIAMGDDSLEANFLEEYGVPKLFTNLGMVPKPPQVSDSILGLEFCSGSFSSRGWAPVDCSRSLYRLLSHALTRELQPEIYNQFLYEIRYHPLIDNAEFICALRRLLPAAVREQL